MALDTVDQFDDSFMDQYAGVGTEELAGGGIAFLGICQKLTEEGMEAGKKLGEWFHSGLQKNFGKTVDIVPLGWKPIWIEKNELGRTVAYHEKDSIPLSETGSGKTYKCVSSETGNKVERTTCIPFLIPSEENSMGIYIPNVASGETIRAWRKVLSFNRLSSGAKAPIFSHVWKLSVCKKSENGNTFYVLERAEKGMQLTKEYMLNAVVPVLELVANPIAMLPAPKMAEAVEADDLDETVLA